MAERSRGMGRGLAAILSSERPGDARHPELRNIPIELVAPNPRQPRLHFDEQALVGLADSLKACGVLQPVLVRPLPGGSYELIAGERRVRAARMAGFDTIPAVVEAHDDQASLELALIENMVRQDLNPVEEARACALLVDELGLTREEVGRRVGRSRVAVSNLLRILDLPDEALELLEAGRLTEGHGRALLLAVDHASRRGLARSAAEHGWTVRHTEDRARAVNPGTGETKLTTRVAPRPRADVDPDQAAATAEIEEALGRALGRDVAVAPAGTGYRISLTVDTHAEAMDLAERLGAFALN